MGMSGTAWIYLLSALLGAAVAEITDYKRVCYYASWSIYRAGVAKFSADNITDTTICTHYIYSFAGVDPENKTIIPLEYIDERGGYTKLTDLKKRDSDIKVLLALGGLSFGVEKFAKLSNTSEGIDEFCVNAIDYLRKWNFDGVDVDWEYPTQRGGYPEDRDNFVTLLQKLRESFENESTTTGKPRLLLTSAVPILKDVIDVGYDRKSIGEAVDFLNIMVYDLHNGYSTIKHHAPMYPRVGQTAAEQLQNVEWGMAYWAEEVSKDKLILGLPLYGRAFRLVNSSMNHMDDPANGAGTPGPYLKASGPLAYYEMCKLINTGVLSSMWSEEHGVPYAVSKTDWVGYDNMRSAKAKANFVKDHQYGGVMIWELSFDDFGDRHCEKGDYPMINTLKQTLFEAREECLPGTYGKLNHMGCSPCSRNTYQPNTSQIKCLDCTTGLITPTEGSVGPQDCMLDCVSGWEYDYSTTRCSKCPVGFYRVKPNSWNCIKCPSGNTTMSTASTKCVPIPVGFQPKEPNFVHIKMELQFQATECRNINLQTAAILTTVKSVMASSNTTWSGVCSDVCSNIKLGVVKQCGRRTRRDVANINKITAEIIIQNVPEELTDGKIIRKTESVISDIMNNRLDFSKLNDYMLMYLGAIGLPSSSIACQLPNHAVNDDICVPCATGSYYDPVISICVVCPYGTYQDKEAANFCKPCPGILSTQHTGSNSKTLCLSECIINPDYCGDHGECIYNETIKICKCKPGFEGEYCTKRIETPYDNSTIIAIGVGGAIAVLLTVLIIVASCACWRYSKRPRKYEDMKTKLRQSQRNSAHDDHKNVSLVKVIPSDIPTEYYYDTRRSSPATKLKQLR